MKNSVYVRANIVFVLTMLSASAITMLWLFWRFPLETGIATIAVLIALLVSARLAKSSDSDYLSDFDSQRDGLSSH